MTEKKPYFSIVIPTKDRVELAKEVVFQTLKQTFQDFEIVLVDNGSSGELYEWATAINEPKLRPYRTGGLSMPDNWQFGFEKCNGEIVLMSEDKIFLKQNTLEICRDIFRKNKSDFITWCIGIEIEHPKQAFSVLVPKFIEQDSMRLVSLALEGKLDVYQKTAPRAINMAVRHDFALEVQKRTDKLCVPICPDYSFGCFLLGEAESYLQTYAKLSYILNGSPSNGTEVMKGTEKGKSFFREIGIDIDGHVAEMPCKIPLFGNTLLADMIHFWKKTRLGNLANQIDLKSYWLMIVSEILISERIVGKDTELVVNSKKEIRNLSIAFRFKILLHGFHRFYRGWPNRTLKMRDNLSEFLKAIKIIMLP
jgi:glycosyltransferase involved in cell wall biosynthesis